MIKKFAIYNYQFFWQKRKESENLAWFSTSGFLSMGYMFNITAILHLVLGLCFAEVKLENPAIVLIAIPWSIIFSIIFFNKSLKSAVIRERNKPVNRQWRIYFWVYYVITVIIFAHSMSFYSNISNL
jgi:anti-sigma-K factor RskA